MALARARRWTWTSWTHGVFAFFESHLSLFRDGMKFMIAFVAKTRVTIQFNPVDAPRAMGKRVKLMRSVSRLGQELHRKFSNFFDAHECPPSCCVWQTVDSSIRKGGGVDVCINPASFRGRRAFSEPKNEKLTIFFCFPSTSKRKQRMKKKINQRRAWNFLFGLWRFSRM